MSVLSFVSSLRGRRRKRTAFMLKIRSNLEICIKKQASSEKICLFDLWTEKELHAVPKVGESFLCWSVS